MLRFQLVLLGLGALGGAALAFTVPACATATRVDTPVGEGGAGDETGTGGGDAGDSGGGGNDAPSGGPGVSCNGTTCPGGQVCCANSSSGVELSCTPEADCKGDAGTPVECDGQEDCDTLNPICCATILGGTQVVANCHWQSAKVVCTGSCNTSIASSCNDQSKMRVCHTSADCTDGDFTSCCEYRIDTLSFHFCVDDAHRDTAAKSGTALNCDPP